MKEPKFSCELCGKTYDLDTLIPIRRPTSAAVEKLPKTHIGTDSYVAVHLLEKQNALNFNSLRKVAEQVQGTEGAGAFRKKSHQAGLFSVRVLTSSTLTSSTFELFRQFVISLALF